MPVTAFCVPCMAQRRSGKQRNAASKNSKHSTYHHVLLPSYLLARKRYAREACELRMPAKKVIPATNQDARRIARPA
jgi:hypothetical protein